MYKIWNLYYYSTIEKWYLEKLNYNREALFKLNTLTDWFREGLAWLRWTLNLQHWFTLFISGNEILISKLLLIADQCLKKKKMKATIRKSCHSVRSEVWVSVSSPCDLFIIVFTKPLSYPPCWNCEPQTGTWTHEAWTQTWPKSMVFWLRSHSWFQDLMKLRFLMSHGRKNSVRGKV